MTALGDDGYVLASDDPRHDDEAAQGRDVRQLTPAERHALIRAAMSSMAIEGVHVPYEMAQDALEIAIARVAAGQ